MKTIYVLRHAKAESGDAQMSDHDRPLSERGLEQCAVLAAYLQKKSVTMDTILCSDAVRTKQTCDTISRKLSPSWKATYDNALYLASCGDLTHVLQGLPDSVSSALLIGHNPGLHELAIWLTNPRNSRELTPLLMKFPTGTYTAWEANIPSWQDLSPQCGRLIDYVTPKMLEAMHTDTVVED